MTTARRTRAPSRRGTTTAAKTQAAKTRSQLLSALKAECKRRFERTFGQPWDDSIRDAAAVDEDVLKLGAQAVDLCRRIYKLLDDLAAFDARAIDAHFNYWNAPYAARGVVAWAAEARSLTLKLPSRLYCSAPTTTHARVEFVRRASRELESRFRLGRALTAKELAPMSILCDNLPASADQMPLDIGLVIQDERRTLALLMKHQEVARSARPVRGLRRK